LLETGRLRRTTFQITTGGDQLSAVASPGPRCAPYRRRKPSICELGGLPLGRHVLNQPALPKPEWEAEVDKMRTAFKAPIDAKDVGAILDYLVSIKGVN
jgi:hypothetical protein